MGMRINLILSEGESKNLEALLLRYGRKAPEYIRSLITEKYESQFPGYRKGPVSDLKNVREYTAEEVCLAYCSKYGGKVDPVLLNASMKIGAVRWTMPFEDSGDKMLEKINNGRRQAAQLAVTMESLMEKS